MENKTSSGTDLHKQFAISCFNDTWKILEKENASDDEICEGIRLAHASTWHWSKCGDALNQQRGEWICSRVYAHFGFGDMALYYAKRCYDLTLQHDFKDFDLGYGLEAMARAYSVLKNKQETKKFLDLAFSAAEKIEKEEDKKWFLKDLNSITI